MFKLGKQIKPIMMCFSIIAFFLIGYAESGESLHEAAKKGNLSEVKRLIEEGADVYVKDENSHPPLYIAVGQGHKDIAELLISKGADVNAVDKKGRTPLDLANYSHHKDLAELLIKHGGETRSPWSGSPAGRLL